MNIVKLKDIIKPGDEFFNHMLKGKYAYWIHMRYIVPLSYLDYAGYIACENNIKKLLQNPDGSYPQPYGRPCIDCQACCDIYDYIDSDKTSDINGIGELIVENDSQTDAELTLDDIKKFRTWLANSILLLDQDADGQQMYDILENNTTMMLEYYKQGMIDDVIKTLTDFSAYNTNEVKPQLTGCGCCGTTATLDLLKQPVQLGCDPVEIYKMYIYNKMVSDFSDMNFWLKFPERFLLKVKLYIDNILKAGLSLSKLEYISPYVDCGGLSEGDTLAAKNKYILSKLSETFQILSTKDVRGKKNFIKETLTAWSSLLYEKMQWV